MSNSTSQMLSVFGASVVKQKVADTTTGNATAFPELPIIDTLPTPQTQPENRATNTMANMMANCLRSGKRRDDPKP